jgi:hypothetical protein
MHKICTEWFVFFLFPTNFITCRGGGGVSKCDTLHNMMGKKIILEPFEPIHVTVKLTNFLNFPSYREQLLNSQVSAITIKLPY